MLTGRLHLRTGRTRRAHVGGAALIEALVSTLIFMTGVLGVISLQSFIIKAQGSSQLRVEAVYLASELSARMWADAGHLDSYEGDDAAANDYLTQNHQDWLDRLAALPDGQAGITVDAGGLVSIVIGWRAAGAQDDDVHRYVLDTAINR